MPIWRQFSMSLKAFWNIWWEEAVATLFSRLSFQKYLYIKQPWKSESRFLLGKKKGKVGLLLIINYLASTGLKCLSSSTAQGGCRHPSGLICITPMGLGGEGSWCKCDNAHGACLPWFQKAPLWPGVACLLLPSMNSVLLACKLNNISYPSQFLTSR